MFLQMPKDFIGDGGINFVPIKRSVPPIHAIKPRSRVMLYAVAVNRNNQRTLSRPR
jgi:hypothetical protein